MTGELTSSLVHISVEFWKHDEKRNGPYEKRVHRSTERGNEGSSEMSLQKNSYFVKLTG